MYKPKHYRNLDKEFDKYKEAMAKYKQIKTKLENDRGSLSDQLAVEMQINYYKDKISDIVLARNRVKRVLMLTLALSLFIGCATFIFEFLIMKNQNPKNSPDYYSIAKDSILNIVIGALVPMYFSLVSLGDQ